MGRDEKPSYLPKVVFLDTSNGIHAANLCSRTNKLHANVRSDLNNRVLVVCELRGGCIWVKFYVWRNKLLEFLALPIIDTY